MHRSIILTAATALAVAASAAAASSAGAATTDGGPGKSPVSANVTVATGLTVTGITGSVNFGTATVGQTVTVPGAEKYTVATNNSAGFSVTLSADNSMWQKTLTPGVPMNSTLGNEALSVKNAAGSTVTAAPGTGTVQVESGPSGATNLSEDWSLTIPSSFTESGALYNTYELDIEPR